MLDNIKGWIQKNTKFVTKIYKQVKKPLVALIAFYLALIIVIIITLYWLCLYDWMNGKAVFANLLLLLERCVSPSFVAAITFIGGAFIDSDGDGIPDSFDKNDDNASEAKPERRRRE